MLAWGFILLGSLAWLGAAHPVETDVEPQWMLRERRSPMAAHTTILIRGQPSGDDYNHERQKRAAYATGGTVAAGSRKNQYNSDKYVEAQPEASESDREKPRSAEGPYSQEEEVPDVEYGSEGALEPHRKPKAPKRRPVEDEEEVDDDYNDDDDDDSVARNRGRPGGSVFRNFFPMSFGAKLRRARDTESNGGDVRSIANSFSTGRGAVASSSAKAYGSPNTRENKRAQLRI